MEISGNLLALENSGNLKYLGNACISYAIFCMTQSETQHAEMLVSVSTVVPMSPCWLKYIM